MQGWGHASGFRDNLSLKIPSRTKASFALNQLQWVNSLTWVSWVLHTGSTDIPGIPGCVRFCRTPDLSVKLFLLQEGGTQLPSAYKNSERILHQLEFSPNGIVSK